MQDTVEIKLPISGSTVEIRNYTTRDDDERSEFVLYQGVKAEQSDSEDGYTKLSFPVANMMAAQATYIPRLVKSIDGDSSNIQLRIKELRSEDYEAISDEVDKVVNEHSPKVREAKKASKNVTTAK